METTTTRGAIGSRAWIRRLGASAVLAVLALVLLPDLAHACPVCFDARDENRQAFIATAVFLSVLPLSLVASAGLWIRKRSKDADAQDALEAGEPDHAP